MSTSSVPSPPELPGFVVAAAEHAPDQLHVTSQPSLDDAQSGPQRRKTPRTPASRLGNSCKIPRGSARHAARARRTQETSIRPRLRCIRRLHTEFLSNPDSPHLSTAQLSGGPRHFPAPWTSSVSRAATRPRAAPHTAARRAASHRHQGWTTRPSLASDFSDTVYWCDIEQAYTATQDGHAFSRATTRCDSGAASRCIITL